MAYLYDELKIMEEDGILSQDGKDAIRAVLELEKAKNRIEDSVKQLRKAAKRFLDSEENRTEV